MKIPKPRKIKHKTHKFFGDNSYIIDDGCIESNYKMISHHGRQRVKGSRVMHPDDYGKKNGGYDNRSRAELRNADERMLSREEKEWELENYHGFNI